MKQNRKTSTSAWILVAIAIRVIAAVTRVNWHYPDEWYQTAEFSRLLLGAGGTYSHEMGLHLRNLSWPAVLMLPLGLSHWIAPHWTQLRLILCQLFAGALDFAAILCFVRFSKKWPEFWRTAGLAILVIPWFRVQDSVSLGAEHVSVCLIWIALVALNEERFLLAGLMSLAIFAVKYPAGLVAAGFALALFWRSVRSRNPRPFIDFIAGALLGSVLFGLADWIFYGRPWESLWMYLQYNVFTSAGVEAFGRQSLFPYFDFIQSRWLHLLLPVGFGFLILGAAACARGIRRAEPWAWAFVLYLGGHLLVSHREARFMMPAEALLLFGALQYGAERFPSWRPRNWKLALVGGVLILNFPLFLKALVAESGTLTANYFEIDQRLEETPRTCAVISQRPLSSLLLPETGASLAIGYFAAERRRPTFPQAAAEPLAWISREPKCSSEETVLLLVDRPDVSWIESGCRLQRSGVLELLPQKLWLPFLRRGWVSGPWYGCPSSILSVFKNQSVEQPLVEHLIRFETLPQRGISSEELVRFGRDHEPPHACRWTC